MFAASKDRRFVAERLLFVAMWGGGLLAWGHAVGERSEPARPVPAASAASLAAETDWRGLSAELAALAGKPRTAVGGR